MEKKLERESDNSFFMREKSGGSIREERQSQNNPSEVSENKRRSYNPNFNSENRPHGGGFNRDGERRGFSGKREPIYSSNQEKVKYNSEAPLRPRRPRIRKDESGGVAPSYSAKKDSPFASSYQSSSDNFNQSDRSQDVRAERVERGDRAERTRSPFNSSRGERGGNNEYDRSFNSQREYRAGGERQNREPRQYGESRQNREPRQYGESRQNREPRQYGERAPRGEGGRFGGDRDNNRGFNSSRGYNNRGSENPSHSQEGERFNRRGVRSFQKPIQNKTPYGGGDREQSFRPRFEKDRKPYGERSFSGDRNGRGGKFNSNKPYSAEPVIEGEVRLNRFVAMSGVCSRREADELIAAGEITVNGSVVTTLGAKVSQNDVVERNGEVLKGERLVYIVMNKPKNVVTTVDDPNADKTVIDLLQDKVKERVFPVGRLDKNSLGVILLTNDGQLTKELTHPSFEKKKIYHVFLDKPVKDSDMEQLAHGVELEDGLIYADELSYVEDNLREVGIEIHSGKNRIVRRMFEHLGYQVLKLDRVYFAGITKKNLKRGFWRYLTAQEVGQLKNRSVK